jgi:hypothetical protein
MDDGVQQQALGVDQQMPLLALDFLARVIAMAVDRGPPFSALLTLWLSMIAYSAEVGRRFRAKSATCSNRSRPGIPLKSAGVASSAG